MSDVIDLSDHRERVIMRRVEGIGERVGARRVEGESDADFEMRVLETAAASVKSWARERAEEARREWLRTHPLRLSAEYMWMHRRRVPHVHDFYTMRHRDHDEWLLPFDGERRPPIPRDVRWQARCFMSRRGDRYIVVEPDGWDGVEWEDLDRAYDHVLAQQDRS